MTTSTAAVVQLFGVQQAHDAKLRLLQQGLSDAIMVSKFADLTRNFHLSKPLAAAFEAVPGFTNALKSFPKQELLNIVAEHPSSLSNVAALESFNEAETEQVSTLAVRAEGLAEGFDQLLGSIGNTASSLREQISNAEEKLDLVDDIDDLVAGTPVMSLSDTAYGAILTTVSDQLAQVSQFSSESLRAAPQSLHTEINTIASRAADYGQMFGFALGEYGIVDAERSEQYQPGTATFAGMGLTKDSLIYHLSQAREILNQFDMLAHQREHLVETLRTEAQAMPDTQNTDEVTYGFEAHSVLIGCYTGFVTKLVMGGVYAISMLLQVSDTILADVGHG